MAASATESEVLGVDTDADYGPRFMPAYHIASPLGE